MSQITRKEVLHVAQLSQIELAEDEVELFGKQLGAILKAMDKLNEVDTEGVEPFVHTYALKNITRKDAVNKSMPKEKALENAASVQDGYFKVPRIVE
jgi:aspartyl-tRNA(Asn)/glutamyl-tRNA(Gln) amidotransferase subunit C